MAVGHYKAAASEIGNLGHFGELIGVDFTAVHPPSAARRTQPADADSQNVRNVFNKTMALDSLSTVYLWNNSSWRSLAMWTSGFKMTLKML